MAPISDSDADSLFRLERISQWISLPPASLSNPLPALCASFFSPLLLTYYPPAGGIVLAWQDIELSDEPPTPQPQHPKPSASRKTSQRASKRAAADAESGISESEGEDGEEEQEKPLLLKVVDEYSAPFVWATATLLVFRPRKNAWVEAHLTTQTATHITLSYLNAFSISVLRNHMPRDWSWCDSSAGGAFSMTGGQGSGVGGEGYWMDKEGRPVERAIRLRIRDWDARFEAKGGRGFLRIEGSLLEEAEERDAGERWEGERRTAKAKSALKASTSRAGAQEGGRANAEAMEAD
ncbi:uncharacterized protein EI97DRAFT_430817 [Westerdykella ornata]|uniref:RPA43 OB domain-containing protein n=1 Tax=Westerdykella ornata TaxID=318751 RepID=A0A6A6JUM9_WESOR|nr:uncharacterized protein EI97DRAFT_430817 [Westerdykella ornata]KAF2279803.1 hypothetical protein EI97DRAFT_430817 [Westerdykella ornata]